MADVTLYLTKDQAKVVGLAMRYAAAICGMAAVRRMGRDTGEGEFIANQILVEYADMVFPAFFPAELKAVVEGASPHDDPITSPAHLLFRLESALIDGEITQWPA